MKELIIRLQSAYACLFRKYYFCAYIERRKMKEIKYVSCSRWTCQSIEFIQAIKDMFDELLESEKGGNK